MKDLLSNKVCFVTGGAGSIGMATARLFLEEGARVFLVDLNEQALKEAAAALGSSNVSYRAADVTRADDVKACFDAAVDTFGKLDVIFSNAGNSGVIKPLAEYPEDVMDSVYRVHVRGAFLVCKHGADVMNDGGSIIITSSVAGLRGDPGVYAYITAKHAQVGLMRAMAKELAERNIRVNTVHPGPVDNGFQKGIEDELGDVIQGDGTEFLNNLIPLGRHADPREIGKSVLYLASDMSSFATGSTLVADGGMSA